MNTYLTVCPFCGPGSIPDRGRVFQRILPSLISLCQVPIRPEPAWQKMTRSPRNSATQPVDIRWKAYVQLQTDIGWKKVTALDLSELSSTIKLDQCGLLIVL